MQYKIEPPKVPKLGYFGLISLLPLLNLLVILSFAKGLRSLPGPANSNNPLVADWLKSAFPHVEQMHNHAIASGQVELWIAQFNKFTALMAVQFGLVAFLLLNLVVFHVGSFVKKSDEFILAEFRNPVSIRKPPSTAYSIKCIIFILGLIFLSAYFIWFAAFNGSAYAKQFYGDLLIFAFMIIYFQLLHVFLRTMILSKKSLQAGSLPLPPEYHPTFEIIRKRDD